MLRRLSLVIVGMLLLVAQSSWALTVELWGEWPPALRAAYIVGILDDWERLVAFEGGAAEPSSPVEGIANLVACLKASEMHYAEIVDLVESWAGRHPGSEGEVMADLVRKAIEQSCQDQDEEDPRSQI